jgi:anti-sigma regulatory factor (Ser/Thr protein kinase)
MVEHPNVRLSLANTAENLVAVRAVLTGLGEAAGVGAHDLSDIRMAVSEACNNVVMHAYPSERGPMDVAIQVSQGSLRVLVCDRGVGIYEHAQDDALPERSIGLHVIRTLARQSRMHEPAGGGTSVSMDFAAPGVRALNPSLQVASTELDPTDIPSFAASLSVAPVGLAKAILPRLAGALAARAHFSTDRLSDLQLLADTLAEHAARAVCEQHMTFGFGVRSRDLELRIAPLRIGQAADLMRASDLDGLGRVIEKLTDRHVILAGDAHETLALSMLDRSRGRLPPTL